MIWLRLGLAASSVWVHRGVVWLGSVSTALLLAVVFCFHCFLDYSLCSVLGVPGLIISSPRNSLSLYW